MIKFSFKYNYLISMYVGTIQYPINIFIYFVIICSFYVNEKQFNFPNLNIQLTSSLTILYTYKYMCIKIYIVPTIFLKPENLYTKNKNNTKKI